MSSSQMKNGSGWYLPPFESHEMSMQTWATVLPCEPNCREAVSRPQNGQLGILFQARQADAYRLSSSPSFVSVTYVGRAILDVS